MRRLILIITSFIIIQTSLPRHRATAAKTCNTEKLNQLCLQILKERQQPDIAIWQISCWSEFGTMYKYLNCDGGTHTLHHKAIESLEEANKQHAHHADAQHVNDIVMEVKTAADKKHPHDHGHHTHVSHDGSKHSSHSLAQEIKETLQESVYKVTKESQKAFEWIKHKFEQRSKEAIHKEEHGEQEGVRMHFEIRHEDL